MNLVYEDYWLIASSVDWKPRGHDPLDAQRHNRCALSYPVPNCRSILVRFLLLSLRHRHARHYRPLLACYSNLDGKSRHVPMHSCHMAVIPRCSQYLPRECRPHIQPTHCAFRLLVYSVSHLADPASQAEVVFRHEDCHCAHRQCCCRDSDDKESRRSWRYLGPAIQELGFDKVVGDPQQLLQCLWRMVSFETRVKGKD